MATEKPNPCLIEEEGEAPRYEHDFKLIRDWYGDPGVINGTADCSFYRCRNCGYEDHDGEFDHTDDDDGFCEPDDYAYEL